MLSKRQSFILWYVGQSMEVLPITKHFHFMRWLRKTILQAIRYHIQGLCCIGQYGNQ
jgi:hypothetical protein